MIIITALNNLALTKKCLECALAQDPRRVPVLVVNNNSTDGTAAWLKMLRSVRVMSFTHRVSVARMWNLSLDWAFAQGHDRVMVLNNDTEILPETWKILSEIMDITQAGMTTGIGVDSRDQMTPWPGVIYSEHPDFSCFLLSKETFAQVRFDEGYLGAYCEDSDYHVRLHRLGIRALNTGLPFLHHRSSTVKSASPGESKRIQAQAMANRERFFAIWGQRVNSPGYNKLFAPGVFGIGINASPIYTTGQEREVHSPDYCPPEDETDQFSPELL